MNRCERRRKRRGERGGRGRESERKSQGPNERE